MLFGFLGMFLVLLAYFLKSADKVSNVVWHALNGAGACLCLAYAGLTGAWPFVILNVVWGLVALKGIRDHFAPVEENKV